MSCVNTPITILEKYVECIKVINPDYTYSIMHFSLSEEGSPLYWNLDYPQPTSEQLESVVVARVCPIGCIGCIIKRLIFLESRVNELQAELDAFE